MNLNRYLGILASSALMMNAVSQSSFADMVFPSATNKKGELKKSFRHNPRNNRKTKPSKENKK